MAGDLTREELIALWESVTDSAYNRPLLEQPESGIEAIEQSAEQFARASLMVERTTQSMYILPWSGQTQPPAAGAALAAVDVTITRPKLFDREFTFGAGLVLLEQELLDFSESGPIAVGTGRRYVVNRTATMAPGEPSVVVSMLAERAGAGYNLAPPNTIKRFVQAGAGFTNSGASLVPGPGAHRLVMKNEADVVAPEQVGSYLLMIGGANTGRYARIIGYEGSDGVHGGVAILAATGVLRVHTVVGTFVPGEDVTQASGARGRFQKLAGTFFVFENTIGAFAAGAITGQSSGATATVSSVEIPSAMVAEGATAAWLVVGWTSDLELVATHAESPEGGCSPMLDELGDERRVSRSSGELDDAYRQRVATPADVVSPAAIRRVGNRVLAPLGQAICLREVGLPLFRGMFFDGDPLSTDPAVAFAFDFDFAVRPEDRFKLALDYLEFRAFMLIGVPPLTIGEFGIPYDAPHPFNAYDNAPMLTFTDGFPAGASGVYRAVYQAIQPAKGGGVGFDLYIERIGCF